jgi:hypothetical protein
LNYYFAWIAMGKFTIVATVRTRLREAFASILPSQDGGSAQLSKSCVKAAKKMLELFGTIERAGNMTKSSFTDFQGCSIATMILLVAGMLERDLCYEARISFGLECLRRMAGDHIAAINGVHFMEALKAIADEAAHKLRSCDPSAAEPTTCLPAPYMTLPPQDSQPTPPSHYGASSYVPPACARPPPQAPDIPLPNPSWTGPGGFAWAPSYSTSGDPFSLLQFDNEAFLTELTDFEMLGASGS